MATVNSPTGSGQSAQLQLHDIHVPEQISNFPIAPGWWILLILILLGSFWSYKKYQDNKRINANKNKALAMLATNQTLSAKECIALLKWAAMQYFSRKKLAKLYGDEFQTFLIEQLPQKYQESFAQLSSAAFKGQYQAEQQADEEISRDCQQAAKLWLTNALPAENVTQHALSTRNKKELNA